MYLRDVHLVGVLTFFSVMMQISTELHCKHLINTTTTTVIIIGADPDPPAHPIQNWITLPESEASSLDLVNVRNRQTDKRTS